MNQGIAKIAPVIANYDEAIDFYTNKLHFDLVEDLRSGESKRWVVVSPNGDGETSLLLAEASIELQEKFIGNQSGGRVFLFLQTDDFDRDYQNLLKHNITIVKEPALMDYGKVTVFADLYGNLWDSIESSIT